MKPETLCAPRRRPKQSAAKGDAAKHPASSNCTDDASKVVDWVKSPKLNEEHQPVGQGNHWDK
jgi:hypothetical protein